MLNRIGIITLAAAKEVVATMRAPGLMSVRRGQRGACSVLHTAAITWMLVCPMGTEGVVAASGPLFPGA